MWILSAYLSLLRIHEILQESRRDVMQEICVSSKYEQAKAFIQLSMEENLTQEFSSIRIRAIQEHMNQLVHEARCCLYDEQDYIWCSSNQFITIPILDPTLENSGKVE